MLETLSKHDSYFREVAFNICKDKYKADDLVNEMYIRLHKYNIKPKNLKYYAIQSIKNLFINSTKEQKTIDLDLIDFNLTEESNDFEINDYQLTVLNRAKKLRFLDQKLLEESYDKSLRQIEDDYKINYMYTHKRITKAREDVLGIDFKNKYNNRRKKSNGRAS